MFIKTVKRHRLFLSQSVKKERSFAAGDCKARPGVQKLLGKGEKRVEQQEAPLSGSQGFTAVPERCQFLGVPQVCLI